MVDKATPSIDDNSAFNLLLDEEDNNPITGYSKDEIIKQARTVGGDRADELEKAFGIESSYGQDPNAKGNILQIKNDSLRKEATESGIDFSNPSQVSKFYMEKTNEFTKGFDEVYTAKSGTKVKVYEDLNQFGIDKGGANYLTWQQGRFGVLDMVTALKTGKIGDTTVKNMLNNLSEEQRDVLVSRFGTPPYDDTKLFKFAKKGGTKSFIKEWLKIQKEKWDKY
jgi:hypothetical protein